MTGVRIQDLLLQALLAKKENRFEDARRDLLKAALLLREMNVPLELAQVLRDLGEVERRQRDDGAARAHYEEAIGILREQNEALALAHALRHLGDIHFEEEHPALAEPFFHEALAIYRGHGQTKPLDLANAVRSLALLKHDAGENESAKHLWQEARDLYETAHVAPGVAECSARLALLSRRK
jgi:tetratricopeptide (TPR) repeat protein